jgi:hypothetical protein
LPLLFMNKIESVPNANSTALMDYRLSKNNFGKHSVAKLILVLLTSARITLVTIVLLVLNIICVVMFYRFYKQKHNCKTMTCKYI